MKKGKAFSESWVLFLFYNGPIPVCSKLLVFWYF